MPPNQAIRATPSPAADVADRLHSAAIHLLRRLRREDTASGVSTAQFSALSVLVFVGPQTLSALAAAEQVRPPTMSRLVDSLERGNLAVRQRDASDRRVVRVHATEAGRRLLVEGRHRRVAVLAERLDTLPPDDLATVDRAVMIIKTLLPPPQS